MIQAILEHEASEREAVKAREAQIRAVVVQKKERLRNLFGNISDGKPCQEELEARSAPELKELCAVQGITGHVGISTWAVCISRPCRLHANVTF